jgi:hypothetical protein
MFFSNKKNFRVHVRIHPLAFKGQYTLFGIDGIR